VSELVMRLLSRDPTKRPPSATALLGDLRSIMDTMGLRRQRSQSVSRARIALGMALFENFSFPLATASAFGRIQAFNPAFAREVNLPPSEVVGRHLMELFPVDRLVDVFSRVVSAQNGTMAWVRLNEGGKIHLARTETEGEVQVHVVVHKK
jgi:PAS domain-containing protein